VVYGECANEPAASWPNSIESSTASGTEVKLVVPVNVIYRSTTSGGRKLLFIKSLLERMRLTSNSIDS
jgi:hypothetical protein